MKKVITLFQRNWETDRLVRDEITEGAEWVVNGEGRATEKIDGTSCLIRGGKLYKRLDVKKGRTPPSNFEPSQDPDPVTGHWPGWVPVSETDPQDKWHRQAWEDMGKHLPNGTYELIGPKVQGNKYNLTKHIFRLHGDMTLVDVPIDFDGIKKWLSDHPQYEGIVWHHPSGELVKIKRRDFGLSW